MNHSRGRFSLEEHEHLPGRKPTGRQRVDLGLTVSPLVRDEARRWAYAHDLSVSEFFEELVAEHLGLDLGWEKRDANGDGGGI